MTSPTPTLPQLDARLIEFFTVCPVKHGDYLAVTFQFVRYAAIPCAVTFCACIFIWLDNPIVQSMAAAALFVGGGATLALLVGYISDVEKMNLRVKEWQSNNEAARIYIENFSPNVENMIIQRGKTNVANVGNVTTNYIDSETLRVLNRQYSVAQVIIDLINGAGGGRKPKPFSYERVRAALTERGIGQVEHEDWAQAIALLEAGKVIDNGAAPTAWKVVKLGESASAGLDEAMRGKGLQKFTQNGAVTWSAEQ